MRDWQWAIWVLLAIVALEIVLALIKWRAGR